MNLSSLTAATKAEKGVDFGKIVMFGPPIASIAVSVLIVIFIVWPRFSDVMTLQKSNITLTENADKLEKKVTLLSSLDESKLKSQLIASVKLIPSDKEIFNFIGQIEQMRNSSGVAITNLSVGSVGQFGSGKVDASGSAPAPPPPGAGDISITGANEVQMKLSITSDYRSVMQFLNSVYALPRVVLIKDLSLSSAQSQISSSMTINALWAQLPTELASIEAPLSVLTKNQETIIENVEITGSSSNVSNVVPDVQTGRNDLFTPFQ